LALTVEETVLLEMQSLLLIAAWQLRRYGRPGSIHKCRSYFGGAQSIRRLSGKDRLFGKCFTYFFLSIDEMR
jgi:hypothetical protein